MAEGHTEPHPLHKKRGKTLDGGELVVIWDPVCHARPGKIFLASVHYSEPPTAVRQEREEERRARQARKQGHVKRREDRDKKKADKKTAKRRRRQRE